MKSDLKYEKENIELRRGKVLELDAQGYSQHDIATILNVSVGLVNSDLQIIRAQAKENIRLYIEEKLPEEYNKVLAGLNSILKESWGISSSTADNREKISALELAQKCYNAKLDLLTNVTVVEDVIKFVNKGKEVKEKDHQSADFSSTSQDYDGTQEIKQEQEEDVNREQY
jgi:hypothetical protein